MTRSCARCIIFPFTIKLFFVVLFLSKCHNKQQFLRKLVEIRKKIQLCRRNTLIFSHFFHFRRYYVVKTMSSFTLHTAFVCLLQINLLCFVFGSTARPEEYPEQFGARGRSKAHPLGRKVLSHSSQYNASSLSDTDDFLSVLNRRKLLSSYSSCGCSNSCGSGTVYVGYTYDGCSGCCSNSLGFCGWNFDGKQYKTECAECNSNSDCDTREYCSSSNSCYACHSSCKTCDGEWSHDCLTCPSGKHVSKNFWESSGSCVDCTQDSHCGSGEICASSTCKGCHSTCKTCSSPDEGGCDSCFSGSYLDEGWMLDSLGYYDDYCKDCSDSCITCDGEWSHDCLTCPSGKHLKDDVWDILGSSGSCETCTKDSHCPGGSICDVSTLLTTGSYVCILSEDDDGSWWCPEQDDNFWNFDLDGGTKGTLGFSQVFRMQISGKTCGFDWASQELELQMQGNPKSESVIFSFSYGDFKDINLGIFTAESLDGGLCAPIPALSFGIFGFGAGLYICLAIEKFDITDEVMKGELHMQLTAKVDLAIQKYEYDLNSQLLTTFNIDESDENIDLDALPTDLPVAYAASACPSACSSLSIGSAEACMTGVISCQACDLAVCKTYLEEVEVLKEGVQASSPPSSPTVNTTSSILSSTSGVALDTGFVGTVIAFAATFMLA